MAKRKDIDPTFGRRLRALRQSADLTQAQLAELVEMLPHAVARLEAGQREPGWQTVQRFAKALGVTPDAFLSDPPAESPAPDDDPAPKRRGKK